MKHDEDEINEDTILKQFVLDERAARLDSVLVQRSRSLTIVLDRVQNYHNISAVIRSADAFGIADIHLVGEVFEYSRRIALGTERWVELVPHRTPEEALTALRAAGYSLVVLQPENHAAQKNLPPSIPVTALPFEQRLALTFGNERDGVSPVLAEAAEIHAFIPMKGFVESLNISVACAICLFCSTISGAHPEQRTTPLSADEQQQLRGRWLKQSVPHAEAILREVRLRRNWSK